MLTFLAAMSANSVIRRVAQGAGLLAVFVSVADPGLAQADTAADSAVIAESPRGRLTLDDYEAEMAKLAPEARAQFAANRARLVQFLNSLYLNATVANDARAAGLDRDPIVARQIRLLVDKTLAQLWIAKVEQKLAADFDANPDKYTPRAREIYLSDPAKYRTPERIRVSHVLVKIGPEGETAAKERAEALRAKVAAGTRIEDVARETSDDPAAKRNAGDLGFRSMKEMPPELAAAAFAMTKRGEIGPVVKSKSGYHVVEFRDREPSVQRPFDDVKKEILAEIRQLLVENERSRYQGSMFTDPPVKVNEELITRINTEARAAATPIEGSPKAAR